MNPARKPVDIFQVFGETPQVLTDVLQDGVNLAVWRRRLPPQLEDFAALVVSLGQPLADQRVIDVDERRYSPNSCAKRPTCTAMRHSWQMWPGWWRPIPAWWVRSGLVCACGY